MFLRSPFAQASARPQKTPRRLTVAAVLVPVAAIAIATGAPVTALAQTVAVTSVATTATTVPANTPRDLRATLTAPRQITVSWTQPAGIVVTSYELTVVEGGNTTYALSAQATSYTLSNLKQGRFYSFKIRAVSGTSRGPYTKVTPAVYVFKAGETAVPSTVSKTVNPPTSLSVTVNDRDRSASLSWTPPVLFPGQVVVRYVVTATPGPLTITAPGSASSAGFGDLKAGVSYTFSVQAEFADGRKSDVLQSAPTVVGVPATLATLPPSTVSSTVSSTVAPTSPPTTAPVTLPPTTTTTTVPPVKPLPALPALADVPVSKCISQTWPTSASGRPAQYVAGAKAGVYVWFESGVWNVHTYNPGESPVLFSGSIATSSTHKFYPANLEPTSDLVKAGTRTTSFSFGSSYDIDTFRVASPCSRSVTFSFFMNGKEVPTGDIYFGAAGAHPLSSKFVVSR